MNIKNKYTFVGKMKIAYCLFRTKLEFPKARLIRFPFDIRGKKYIHLGEHLTTGVGCRLEAFSIAENKTLHIGNHVQMNDYVHICAMKSVSIGNYVLLASKIYISDNTHGIYRGNDENSSPDIPPAERPYAIDPVIIEDNVWIGENVCVLPGSHIGKGAIVGANSVVNSKIPPYTIAVGTPAYIVKRFDFNHNVWLKTDKLGNFID